MPHNSPAYSLALMYLHVSSSIPYSYWQEHSTITSR